MADTNSLAQEVRLLTGTEQDRPTDIATARTIAQQIRRVVGQNLVGGGEVLKAVITGAARRTLPVAVTCIAVWLDDYIEKHQSDSDEPAAQSMARMNSSTIVATLSYLVASGASAAIEEAIQANLRRRYRRVLGKEEDGLGSP